MMTLSRLNEILDAWESLTWPASRADAAAFRDRFGWTPNPLDGLLFTSDVVPEETSSSFSVLRPDDIVGLDFIVANRPDFQPGNDEYKPLLTECQPYLTTIRQRLGKSLAWSKVEPDGIWRFATVEAPCMFFRPDDAVSHSSSSRPDSQTSISTSKIGKPAANWKTGNVSNARRCQPAPLLTGTA